MTDTKGIRKDLQRHEKADEAQEKKTNRYLKKLVNMEEKEEDCEKKASVNVYLEKIAATHNIPSAYGTMNVSDDELKRINDHKRKHSFGHSALGLLNAGVGAGVGYVAGDALSLFGRTPKAGRFLRTAGGVGGYIAGALHSQGPSNTWALKNSKKKSK